MFGISSERFRCSVFESDCSRSHWQERKTNNPTLKFAVWQVPSTLSFQEPLQLSGEKGTAFLRLEVPAAVLARNRMTPCSSQSDTLLITEWQHLAHHIACSAAHVERTTSEVVRYLLLMLGYESHFSCWDGFVTLSSLLLLFCSVKALRS